MIDVIKNFCDNENIKNGLLLIDMPTGSGKTYNVLEYIFNKIDSGSDIKIFFVTSLKKNLPVIELKKHFEKNGKLDLYEKKFLHLKSNADMLTDNWEEVQKDIPENIKNDERYKNIADDLKFIDTAKKGKNNYGESEAFIEKFKENLFVHKEPAFRRYIENLLSKEYSHSQKRLEAVEKNKKWQWIGKLYPSVFTNKCQIFFLSVDKFLHGNSTIIEPQYTFLNHVILENAIIFIDEFDATKETVLKNIIKNNFKNKIDYINLFSSIHSALTEHIFPSILTTSKTSSEYIEKLIYIFEKIYEKYSLKYSYKLSSDEQDSKSNNFLFNDYIYHTMSNANWILARKDDKVKQCWIDFTDKIPDGNDIKITQMLSEIRGGISFFQNAVRVIADDFRERKNNSQNSNNEDFSRESAVNSVLSEFGVKNGSEEYKFLIDGILSPERKKTSQKSSAFTNEPYNFYKDGFRYYDFIDSPEHDLQSRIRLNSFQDTPEKLIIQLSEKAKVVGISATATIKTVTGNYDIDYLESELGRLKPEEYKTDLDLYFKEQIKDYHKVNIHAEFISGKGDKNDCWTEILENDELAHSVINIIERHTSEKHQMERYIRIAKAFKEFLRHDDIKSFLCMLNKHPRENDSGLDKKILEDVIFKRIAEAMQEEQFNIKESIVYIDSNGYDNQKDTLRNRLAKGEKLFVISVYQTIGAGQNLQYPIPHGLKTIPINKHGNTEKDFDAIYVDKPTNLLVQLGNPLSEEDFAKYIFQIEFLRFHHLNAEISVNSAYDCITNAFKCFITQNNYKNIPTVNLYNCESIKLHQIKTIIQAIGRICRTGNKNCDIYIYADDELKDSLTTKNLENERLYNPEFHALLNKANLQKSKKTERDTNNLYINNANSVFAITNSYIRSYLDNTWSEHRIDEWRRLRKFVLKYPVLSKEQYSSDAISDIVIAKKLYIELPENSNKYWYCEKEDYASGEVHFEEKYQYDKEVSADNARLDTLMKIPGLCEFFNENKWAIDFSSGKYMMSPPLFNNIYKGALGEEIGRYIFERNYQIELQEIDNPDEFELFDYKIADNTYVDFKHWKESNKFSTTEMIDKINSKLEICKGKKAIIANIIANGNNYKIHRRGNIIEIPYLYDINSGKINYNAWEKIKRFLNDTDK